MFLIHYDENISEPFYDKKKTSKSILFSLA